MSKLIVSNDANIHDPNQKNFQERKIELQEIEEQEKKAFKREKNSPFTNFYQFNKAHTKDMIILAGKYPRAHQILLFLLDQMDHYNAIVCSHKVLSEALDISDSTVKRSMKILKENNFIEIYKSGTTNVYVINKQLAWNSWGKNYKYAKFDAKIIISETEQEQNNKEITIEKVKQVKIKK